MRAVSPRMPRTTRPRFSGRSTRTAFEQLRVGRDRSDGRPQLVRGVGDELAEPCLRATKLGLGSVALRERALYPPEHDVERPGEAPDLGSIILTGNSLIEPSRRDDLGGRLHGHQRPEPESHEPPPDDEGSKERGGGHHPFDEHEPTKSAVHASQ